MLAPGHTSPPTTKDKETYGTKNNCMHVQLGQILDKKIQRDLKKKPNNPTASFEEPGEQNQRVGSKSGPMKALCTHDHLSSGQATEATPLARPLDTPTLTPHKEPACSTSSASEQALALTTPIFAAAGPSVKTCLNFVSDL